MNSKKLISRRVDTFYNKVSEETRLDKGMGVFEFERIKSLIEKYIHTTPLTIIDVGGGTGKYSEWLAQRGHNVFLVDPVLKHIKLADRRADRLKNKFCTQLGESRNLKFPNNFPDIVILHGPLYHLQDQDDRMVAIGEAKRVLKRGGVILGFAINFTASTLVGLLNGLIHKRSFFDMCMAELNSGQHNPPDNFPWLLAEGFYHRPEGLKEEFAHAGLNYLNTYAVEGVVWLDSQFFGSMRHEKRRKTLIELIESTETDRCLLPFSPHMMIATQKR